MKRTDLPSGLSNILRRIQYVTIATVGADGQPWNTPVVGRFDDSLNLYWVSHTKAQHSQNIAKEPRIFVVVYDNTVPEGQGLGIYLKMTAKRLTTGAEVQQAKKVYDTQFFKHDFAKHEQFLGSCPQGFYKATLKSIWHNSDSTYKRHFIDVRTEVKQQV